MQPKTRVSRYECKVCNRSLTSTLRLQHHKAAEHAPNTSRDIKTSKDIRTFRDLHRVK